MNRKTMGIVLIVLGLLVVVTVSVGVWSWTDFSHDQKPTVTDNDNSKEDTQQATDEGDDASETRSIFSGSADTWPELSSQSITDNWNISIQLPSLVQHNNSQQTIHSFKYIGPKSQPETEITDGFLITISAQPNTSLPTYLDAAQAPTGTETIIFNGYEAASFSRFNELGKQRIPHIVFMLEDDTTAIDITYATYGASSPRYQKVIEDILDTLSFEQSHEESPTDLITIDTPAVQATVNSPLSLSGEARGYWFFEAIAPVTLTNVEGEVIGKGNIRANENWMSEEFVSFSGAIEYQQDPNVSSTTGTLIFHRANPSGLPENDASVVVPVQLGDSPQ